MQSHTLKRTHKNKKSKTVGRGGTRGKTAGRGTKGQNARAGHKKRPELRDFIKRLPKLRGHGKNANPSIQTKPFAVNLGKINTKFAAGDIITPAILAKAGLFNPVKGKNPVVKVLASGTLDKKLAFTGCLVSASAQAMIEKVGGTVSK